MKIELIPVIEIGIIDITSQIEKPRPKTKYWENPKEWENYFREELIRNEYENYQRIEKGHPYYRVRQFRSQKDLIKIIEFHLNVGNEKEKKKLNLEESCALFGGYALRVNEKVVFTPQCCGTLADFQSWKSITENSFKEGYIACEGHPCPKAKRIENRIQFTFEDEWEDFIPPATNLMVEREKLIDAISLCEIELDNFSKILNTLNDYFKVKNIAKILIYEEE
jgi:hypothetical protein